MIFSTGDTVTLKSGGPYMTVFAAGPDIVETQWFNKDGELRLGDFRPSMLKKQELVEIKA